MHAQRGKNRRGVEEHRHVRCRGQLQAFGDKEELQPEQRTGQQAAAPGAAYLIPAALPADQQSDQQRRNPRAPRRLHHRRDVRCSPLDHHLLHTPDQARPIITCKAKRSALRRSTITATPRTHTTWQPPLSKQTRINVRGEGSWRRLLTSATEKAVWKRHLICLLRQW